MSDEEALERGFGLLEQFHFPVQIKHGLYAGQRRQAWVVLDDAHTRPRRGDLGKQELAKLVAQHESRIVGG